MTSIALRLATACAALLLGACASAPSSSGAASSQAQRPLLLLISIDALRADMLDRGITPNLSQLAREGVRNG